MKRLLATLAKVLEWLAAAAFLLLFLLSVLQIVLRYFFGESLFWLPDLVRFLFIWCIFAGAAVMYYRHEHIVVDFLVKRSREGTQDVLALIQDLVMIIFLAILIYQGIVVSILRMRLNFTVLPLPTGYAYLSIPVAAAVMLLVSAVDVVDRIKKIQSDLRKEPENT
ncbi:MAG: TRAP transporter small permease [Spirochaetes bacterium]|jgi:TRAP-type C4-dicarboxylate transport system permease small subunit|nr:TRAP transporter small permease [Spirochaetota bacterium]